jgi:hypothetical protein
VPDQNMVFIDSREVYHGEVESKDEYVIQTNIVDYSNTGLEETPTIHYSINNAAYVEAPMVQYKETTNYTYTFEGLESGDDVKYYISAENNAGSTNVDPSCSSLDPHHFYIA